MIETITIGGLTLEFLHSKEDTAESLDMFRMTVHLNTRMPVAHYHDSWDEAVHGISGTINFRVEGEDVAVGPGESLFIRRGVVRAIMTRYGLSPVADHA